MENKDTKKISQLTDYYKNKGLTIIGLNDSQGVNTTSVLNKKGLLEYLKDVLTTEDFTPEVINAFSLLMNKTEHIEYFLKNNLSVEEIKLSQLYSAISAFQKVMDDINLPKFLGNVAYAYKMAYKVNKGDENIFITDSIVNSEEPTVIYSSGANDLMREVYNNPFQLIGDYKKRDEKPNYNWTLKKAESPKSLENVIKNVKENFELILSLNNKTDIYALGIYSPKSLQKEELKIFRDLISKYNEKFIELCDKYHITYINTEVIGQKYNTQDANFHITSAGHNSLANSILGHMYNKKIEGAKKTIIIPKTNISFDLSNRTGAKGVINNLQFDEYTHRREMKKSNGYDKKVASLKQKEAISQEEVFKKVMKKSHRNYIK